MFSDPRQCLSTDTLLIHGRAQIGLAEFCRTRGVDYDAVLRQSGMEGLRSDASLGGHISLRDHARSLEVAARLAGDDCFGLNWTRELGAGPEETVAMAVRYAPDFVGALEAAARYMHIVCDVTDIEADLEGQTASLAFRLPDALVCVDQMTDRMMSKVHARLMQTGGGRVSLALAELTRTEPLSRDLHEAHYGAPVRFGARRNRFVFQIEGDGAPNPERNDDLFAALCDLNRRRLDDRRRAEDFTALVSDAISARISDPDLTVADVARSLAISSRGLQRRLGERDLTFHGLHESVRRRMAADLLALSDLPMSEIAYRLGFSAVGNFSRAAKRWFGCPPSEWRQANAVAPRSE
jgi:AraC-like DNA-binding protein